MNKIHKQECINAYFDAVGTGTMAYALERELEMLIRTQLLFVYFKVLEESHFTLGKKNKKHETDNSELKPGYNALKREKGRSCYEPGNITRPKNGI